MKIEYDSVAVNGHKYYLFTCDKCHRIVWIGGPFRDLLCFRKEKSHWAVKDGLSCE